MNFCRALLTHGLFLYILNIGYAGISGGVCHRARRRLYLFTVRPLIPKSFFCFECQWAELLAKGFCPFLLLPRFQRRRDERREFPSKTGREGFWPPAGRTAGRRPVRPWPSCFPGRRFVKGRDVFRLLPGREPETPFQGRRVPPGGERGNPAGFSGSASGVRRTARLRRLLTEGRL